VLRRALLSGGAFASTLDEPGSPGRAYLDLRAGSRDVVARRDARVLVEQLPARRPNMPKAERDAWLARMKRVPPAQVKIQGAGAGGRPRRARRRRARRDPHQVVRTGRDGARGRRLEARRRPDDRTAVTRDRPHDVARWLYRIDANYTWTSPFRQESDYAFSTRRAACGCWSSATARSPSRALHLERLRSQVLRAGSFVRHAEGVVNARTGHRETYYASMVHDALYQFLADGLPLTRVQPTTASCP
jgi:hypothetical protein